MLDTVIVIGSSVILMLLGLGMGTYGAKAFRPFAFITGLIASPALLLFLLSNTFGMEIGTIALVAAGFVGIILGLLCLIVPLIGLSVCGLVGGLIAGTGFVFCVDVMLNNIVPPFLFTLISILITVCFSMFCLLRQNMGKGLSTAFIGGFTTIFGLAVLISWLGDTTFDNYLVLSRLLAISRDLPNSTLVMYILGGFVLSAIFTFLQIRMAVGKNKEKKSIENVRTKPIVTQKKKKKKKAKVKKLTRTQIKRQKLFDDDDYYEDDADEFEEVRSMRDVNDRRRRAADPARVAEGPMRPKAGPDYEGFTENAVLLDSDEIDEPTIAIRSDEINRRSKPRYEDEYEEYEYEEYDEDDYDDYEKEPVAAEEEIEEIEETVETTEEDADGRRKTVTTFSSHKPTFSRSRQNTLADKLDYDPDDRPPKRRGRR